MKNGIVIALLAALISHDVATAADRQGGRPTRRIAPHIVIQDAVGPAFLFPVIGSLEGQFGTFFRSEVLISNFREQPQRIAIKIFERGVDSSTSPVVYRELPAYDDGGDLGLVTEDFLAALGKSGLAAVLVQGVTANNEPDPQAVIDGFTRIYTVQPASDGCANPTGTVSQAMVPVPPNSLNGADTIGYAYGLRQDENFRTNVGIVNLDSHERAFTITVYGTRANGQMSVTVPPNSMNQFALPSMIFGNLGVAIEPSTSANGKALHTDFDWAAYATSVDNRTGDGWTRQAGY